MFTSLMFQQAAKFLEISTLIFSQALLVYSTDHLLRNLSVCQQSSPACSAFSPNDHMDKHKEYLRSSSSVTDGNRLSMGILVYAYPNRFCRVDLNHPELEKTPNKNPFYFAKTQFVSKDWMDEQVGVTKRETASLVGSLDATSWR